VPFDIVATPENVIDYVKDYLLSEYSIDSDEIFYVLPCYDIEDFWHH
jgi:hypothetical protein